MQLNIFWNIIHIRLNGFSSNGFVWNIGLAFQSSGQFRFENNFKRTINCPATQANMNEPNIRSRGVKPDPKQFCMAGAGANDFRWWNRSLKCGFRIHRDSLWDQRFIQIIQCFFLIFWTKLFWSYKRSQKLLDVGTGAKKIRCPDP